MHLGCNLNIKKYKLKVMFHVTETIKRNIRKITDLDLKKDMVFSQNIPDMNQYFELTKLRVEKLEDSKNENEDEVINKFRSKIQAFGC